MDVRLCSYRLAHGVRMIFVLYLRVLCASVFKMLTLIMVSDLKD